MRTVRAAAPFVVALSAATFLASALNTSAEANDDAPAATTSEGAKLADIIVTAQKRPERLQEVPVSEAALPAGMLEDTNISSGTEIARQTANLRASVAGDESQPKFAIRGVSMSSFNLNDISPTGVFYDEVYVGAQYLGGAQMYDMDRVEVLRGPQGTLFGKNTTAGAINFISKAPTFSNGADMTVDYGSYHYMEIKGAAEAPLVSDRLTVRLAFDAAHSDGYITNVTSAGSDRDLSNIDRKSGRLTIGYKNDDGLRATLRVFRVEEDPHSIGAIVTGTGPNGLDLLGRNPRINPYTGAPLGDDEIARSPTFPNEIQVRGTGGYLTISDDLGFATLTSITSHLQGRFLNYVDGDGSIDDLLHATFRAHNRETSQDLRLTSNGKGPFTVIGGLYYYQDNIDVDTIYDAAYVGIPLDQSYRQKRTSYAGYVDSTAAIDNRLTAYAGLRYTDDEGRMSDFRVTPIIPMQPDLTYHDHQPSGRAGLREQIADDVMIYGQFARGYRSSAFNGGAVANLPNVAKPEHLDAYEIGLKSQWLERRMTLNAAAFLYNFTDQQFATLVSIDNQQLVNAGRSRIKGLEVELVAHPTDRLTIRSELGLLETRYLALVLNGVNLAGNQLPEAPRSTINGYVSYEIPLRAAGALSLSANATHVAAQEFDATNAPVFHIDSFWDVGARMAFHPSDDRYEVAAYGKNLTNNQVPTAIVVDSLAMVRFTPLPYPRRFGVEFTEHF